MASPADDPSAYLKLWEAVVGAAVFLVGLGVGWNNVKRDIARSKERHDGHDQKFKELDNKLGRLAEKEDLREFKADVIREMYALFDSGPRPPVDRRREPR